MKNKYITTYWIDVLTYIILPFITLVSVIGMIRTLMNESFSWKLLPMFILELSFIVLYVLTVINSHKRTKVAYYLFRVLIWTTAIRASVDFAFSGASKFGSVVSLIGYLVICGLVWIYPNEIYLKKRKELFKGENKIKIPCLNKSDNGSKEK